MRRDGAHDDGPKPEHVRRRAWLLGTCLIVLVTLAAYTPALSGGFVWELMANSTGELEPEFMIYSRCDEALAAWTAGTGAQLALHPDPAVAVEVLDDMSCPSEVTLAVTTCNIGSEPAASAPFSVEFDDEFENGIVIIGLQLRNVADYDRRFFDVRAYFCEVVTVVDIRRRGINQ